ncbi:MAG: GerMN domain-containing protein [Nitrospiraceae bacterium]|nr:GerMN domain-containing protein [Nitrospiraceae bacterium]
MSVRKAWIPLVLVLFLIGASVGYYVFQTFFHSNKQIPEPPGQQTLAPGMEDFFTLRLYFPIDNRLQLVERKVVGRTRQAAIADAVIEEFFKGPGLGIQSPVPQNVRLLGLYRDSAQILYVDLSAELRRNFQGDALSEYLLLKGLYESLISNLQDVQDIKVLVEGKEVETLGGHFYLKYPLKNIVSYDFPGDEKIADGESR